MSIIKAAVCHEFSAPLVVENIQLRKPEAGEVEITLSACAICHSDISYAEGGWGGTLPAVYGHEAAGHISAVGSDVKGYSVGNTVVATLLRSCGSCAPCTTGAPAYCSAVSDLAPLTTLDNQPLEQGMAIGAFAEKVVVHQSQIAKIPADMPMDAACLLSCGVITGVGAVVNTAGL
ncbi:MAG: alcohol dehydrogenase catalytic domain-containing protein, partial [Paracoccaceae bacterium]